MAELATGREYNWLWRAIKSSVSIAYRGDAYAVAIDGDIRYILLADLPATAEDDVVAVVQIWDRPVEWRTAHQRLDENLVAIRTTAVPNNAFGLASRGN
jgi:hypothetical protein